MTIVENEPVEGNLVLIRQKTNDATTYLATGVVYAEELKNKVLRVGLIQIIINRPENKKNAESEVFVGDIISLDRDVLVSEVTIDEKPQEE